MFETLKSLKEAGTEADFLFPGIDGPVKGKVSQLKNSRIVIEAVEGGTTFQYLTNPNAVVVVQKKAP